MYQALVTTTDYFFSVNNTFEKPASMGFPLFKAIQPVNLSFSQSHAPTARHVPGLTCNGTGGIAAQPERQAGHLIRARQLPDGLVLQKNLVHDLSLRHGVQRHLLPHLTAHQGRVHIARADAIDGDTDLGRLEGEYLGETQDAVLGGDVGRLEGRGGLSVDATNIQHSTAAVGFHVLEHDLAAQKSAG